MLTKPKSIKDYGGLQAYLDSPDIRARHNGYGYEDLVKNKHNGAAFVRDLFGLGSRSTAYRWISMLEGK